MQAAHTVCTYAPPYHQRCWLLNWMLMTCWKVSLLFSPEDTVSVTNVLHVKWNLACPNTVHFTFLMLPQKYKITTKQHPWKKLFLVGHPVALFGQGKDFHQHHIWCFPLPCSGEKSPWMPHISPAMISCDVLTSSIHGIQQRHLILWSMIIFFPPPFSKNGSDCAVGNLHIYAPKLDWLQ